jgi:hypothetical protein
MIGESDDPGIESEEFRCGFPKPLPPEPVRILPLIGKEEKIKAWIHCQRQAIRICKESDLAVKEVSVFMVRNPPESIASSPIILIFVENTAQKTLWKPVLTSIFFMLRAENSLDVGALIFCKEPRPDENMRVYPIESSHPLVDIWPKSLLKGVLWLLRWHELQFNAVEVFRLGTSYRESRPTILITTKSENQRSCQKVMDAIGKFCSAKGADLPILIQEGRIWGTRTSLNSTGGTIGRVYTKNVPMGTSIGVESKGAGTMGGYVKLRNPGNGATSVYGLTNYHVVRGSNEQWLARKFNISLWYLQTLLTLHCDRCR